MAATLRDHVQRLRGVKARLEEPVDFFAAHKDEYRDLCAEVTVRELTLARPDEVTEEEWLFRVETLAGNIQAALLEETETGVRFWLSPAAQPQLEPIAGAQPGLFGLETVQEWVAAGRAGDEEGKQLDDRDMGRSDEQIAKRVWWAMYTGKSLNSHDKIREFLVTRGTQLLAGMLPQLLNAWKQNVIVRMRKDYQLFLRGVLRSRMQPY